MGLWSTKIGGRERLGFAPLTGMWPREKPHSWESGALVQVPELLGDRWTNSVIPTFPAAIQLPEG